MKLDILTILVLSSGLAACETSVLLYGSGPRPIEPIRLDEEPATAPSPAQRPTYDEVWVSGEVGVPAPTSSSPAAGPRPVPTDGCDDPSYLEADWQTTESGALRLHVLPGSAAEHDLADIAATRQRAYDDIREALAIEAAPVLDLYLSPSRVAAQQLGVGAGLAYPGEDRLEVIYTGSADGYETRHYGHELSHLLAYYIDPARAYHLPLFEEGLAEVLDQSQRDLHRAYAANLVAGVELRSRLAGFDDGDVWGSNYGRAGSLVSFLIDTYGMSTFLELWRAAYLDWEEGCAFHPDYGCVEDAMTLEVMLDGVLTAVTGDGWDVVAQRWSSVVQDALSAPAARLSAADEAEIENLVALMDAAAVTDDPEAYRSVMDGFYCDWLDEAGRQAVAERAVAAYAEVRSEVVAVHPIATVNFTAAVAVVQRRELSGAVGLAVLWLERFPIGWRVTYGPDWN